MSQSQVWNRSKLRAQNPARWAVWYLPGGQFWHVLDIQCQIDLGPSLGKKLSQAIEIHSKIITKSSKIWKTRKSRKTAENIMSDQIFDVQIFFSLCWRSKSFESRFHGSPHIVRTTLWWQKCLSTPPVRKSGFPNFTFENYQNMKISALLWKFHSKIG